MPAATAATLTRAPAAVPRKAALSDARRRDLAGIHMLAAALGMDTADRNPASEYRSLLQQVGGSASAAAMTDAQRRLVLRHLGRLNRERTSRTGSARRHETQAEFVAGLWNKLGRIGALQQPTPAGLDAFVKGMTGIDSVRFLDTAQGTKVVEALKAWIKRAEAKA
jgi:hypothetical protein